ncbi:aminotransferase class V-fold PLP-dependent enzyme [Ruminococcaceae bacterium OttesenSCG-928-A11]|nr:aminotransferase class V-fold PLP-dependent enzyme [Ruminococcaceae bacterium OttesenSCG-928-A11]
MGRKSGQKTDETRNLFLKYLKLSPKTHFVSFTLNTTYGINLILSQLKIDGIEKVMTSDIEHNSPFLSTISFAKKHNIPREVMTREEDGSIDVSKYNFDKAVVVVNSVSNFDCRELKNLPELVKKVHKSGGIVIIDAAQAIGHYADRLAKTDADVICASAHKMYAPSLGVIITKRDILPRMELSFIGGGMVDDVTSMDEYILSSNSPQHAFMSLEAGLQAWGEIIATGEAIKWIEKNRKSSRISEYAKKLFDFLESSDKIHLVNNSSANVISFYHETIDSHLLAGALSDQGIMARSGYFCCHYYLDKVKHYPPLLRLSLGLHNTEEDINKVITELEKIV